MYPVIFQTASPTPMGNILKPAGELFGWATTSLGTLINTISSHPILFLGFLVSLVGLIVGLTKRLVRIK